MGSEREMQGPDPPDPVVTEVLHESERTRVTRVVSRTGSVIKKEFLGPAAQARLLREVEFLKRLRGVEGVAQLASGSEPGPESFLLVDVHGTALSGRTVPVDPVRLLNLAERLARGLAGLHRRGVVHRNINPANIVVDADDAPYLVDFALATSTAPVRPDLLRSTEIVGTVAYLAPEQTGRTARPVDARADLYAVGAMLYELATGAPPFGSADPMQVIHSHLTRVPVPPSATNPLVPAGLSAIIMHLLEKEPDDRYQSAEGLVFDLALLRRGGEVVHPGERDLPARALVPSRLAGRDREIAQIRDAFAAAMEGRCRGLLLGGAAGVGKTTLVDELRSTVANANGWFVAGKFDQYRRDQEYDGVTQAFRALGRLLLAEPEKDLHQVRDALLQALGPNAGLMAMMMPELGALLGVAAAPGDPMTTQARARRNAAEILRVVACRERPLVLFVDDLQWAGRAPLDLVDLVMDSGLRLEGLLLVGAFRDSEVDAAHPLASMVARWGRLPDGPRVLRVGNLAPDGQAALVADLLRLPSGPAADLAGTIAPSTRGNPYETVELLNALGQDGTLTRDTRGWRWEPEVLRRRLAGVDVSALLAARAGVFPSATRAILAAIACLAGRVELDLLEAATGLASDEIGRLLAPALADGFLVLEPANRSSVRFHHDLAQESVIDDLDGDTRRATRLGLARRLAGRDEYSAVAAEQYLLVADTVHAEPERQVMAGLFERAASQARMLSNYGQAERFLAALLRSVDRRDKERLVAAHVDRHAVLYMLGRLEDADEEYQVVIRLRPRSTEGPGVTAVQVSSLINRGRSGEALALGLEALRHLGLAIPARERLEAETDRGLDALYAWIDETTEADDLRRPKITDRSRLDTVRLINRLIPAAFICDRMMSAWLAVTILRIWATDGPDAALIGPAGHAALVTVARRGDYRTGYRMMRRLLAVGRARGYEPELWRARFLYVVGTGHWFEPLEDNVSAARRTLAGLFQAGDLQTACWTYYTLVCDFLDLAPSLADFVAEADEALRFAARTGNGHAEKILRACRDLAGELRGEPTGRPDAAGLAAAEPTVAFHLHLGRAVAAAVLDHSGELERHTDALMPLLSSVESIYHTATVRMLRALALAGRARAARARQRDRALVELEGLVEWLAERAADAPVNFGHMLRLVEAERAWALGDFREAVCTFDLAQREVSARARPWHRALILERAARFYLAHGVDQAAHGLLVAASDQYLAWGATAKVRQLDYAFPLLRAERSGARPNSQPPPQPAHLQPVVTTGTLDLLGIVAASQALSSETSIDGLRVRVVGILSEITGSTGVRLLLRDQETHAWTVPLDEGGTISLEEAGRRKLLPPSVVWYAERTGEPVLIDDAIRDDRFSRDPYLATMDRCSLLAVPIILRDELHAMLLLENRLIRCAFTTDRLEGITLIARQLAVCLDNALVYASLERRVAERTEQLAAANHRLEQLSATDPLTGLANRRQLNEFLNDAWYRAASYGTPLALAMIDIDHFKAYNDFFGHTVGDLCLRRVAACLARCTRDTDLAARYGGEEFVVVMPGADSVTATQIAHRLRTAVEDLAEPHPRTDERIVTVSIGIATTTPGPRDDVAALLEVADAALYLAKNGGRNRVEAGGQHEVPADYRAR
ncbi:diguanylate cyclase [Pseudofrankia inefficax]|uniref:Putative phytochrome sensor protein n=1 Tax=Pseudofrankia inefficax (strain DSM 45817 / CECT 9037 / DDB 130130 / EuI1c) TaxID=298654 RepID=E3IWM3_PSEI1|nr:diguanylate cyclase [Pseudofrankia inefficax]ADP81353.1 putative phytochrome sensor protein [Pseudofrankia inefficax]